MPAQAPRPGEHAASKLRERLGLTATAPVVDIVEAIEALDVPVFLTALPPGISGLANRLNGRWYVVGDTRGPSGGHLRFTLAHELGHVTMNHRPSIDDGSTLRWSESGDPQEIEANYFAAEFLMPRNAVYDRLGSIDRAEASRDAHMTLLTKLSREFGTTAWVPLYRLRTLDLLEQREMAALENRLRIQRPTEIRRDDIAARFAGTAATRMPAGHQLRQETLERLDAENDHGDS